MSGELRFRGGVSASFYCSFRTANEQWASVSGTNGLLQVSDFVLPFFGDETRFDVTQSVLEVDGCRFDLQRRRRRVGVAEYGNGHPTAQEACMFREFSRLVTTRTRDPHWGEVALKTQILVDACRESAARGREVELA
jgi:predicted dehydrogenase